MTTAVTTTRSRNRKRQGTGAAAVETTTGHITARVGAISPRAPGRTPHPGAVPQSGVAR
ncbi:hypothetical protein [Streptomyces sp. NPDC001770]